MQDQKVALPVSRLKPAIRAALCYAAKPNEPRYFLQGVCLRRRAGEGLVEVAASDGFRLYVQRIPVSDEDDGDDFEAILPVEEAKRLVSVMPRAGDAWLYFHLYPGTDRPGQMILGWGGAEFETIPRQFPDARRLLPRMPAVAFRAPKVELMAAINQINRAQLAEGIQLKNRTVRVFVNGDVSLSYIKRGVQPIQFGWEPESKVSGTIALRYFRDMVRHAEGDTVKVGYAGKDAVSYPLPGRSAQIWVVPGDHVDQAAMPVRDMV